MLRDFRNLLRCTGVAPIAADTSKIRAGRNRKVKWCRLLLIAIFLGLTAHLALAEGAQQVKPPPASSEPEEHGLSQKAVEIGRVFGFPITNSMVVSWVVALGLI